MSVQSKRRREVVPGRNVAMKKATVVIFFAYAFFTYIQTTRIQNASPFDLLSALQQSNFGAPVSLLHIVVQYLGGHFQVFLAILIILVDIVTLPLSISICLYYLSLLIFSIYMNLSCRISIH